MRASKEATTLAKLRLAIGFRQSEMADLLGVTPSIIQNIELNKTELPEELADDAARLTGVDLEWLLEDDVSKPIVNRLWHPFTKNDFVRRDAELRSQRNTPGSIAPQVEAELALSLRRLIAITEAALRDGRYDLFSYKVRRALNGLCNEAHARLPVTPPPPKGKRGGVWPDVAYVAADWKNRFDWRKQFKSFLASKGGNAQMEYSPREKTALDVAIAVSKPTGKAAKQPAKLKAGRR
jgi:transcriptional regulator with XRE-family HTH domain